MATVTIADSVGFDVRGARHDIDAIASVGVSIAVTLQNSDTTPFDLTNVTLSTDVADGDDSIWFADYGIDGLTPQVEHFPCVIENATAGQFRIVIPSTAFRKKWGEEMTYCLRMTQTNTEDTALLYGMLRLQEAF